MSLVVLTYYDSYEAANQSTALASRQMQKNLNGLAERQGGKKKKKKNEMRKAIVTEWYHQQQQRDVAEGGGMGRIGLSRCSKKLAKEDIPEAGDRGVAYLLVTTSYYHVG
ncbi:hypothetical protein ASPFODRAFT_716107 [Aspergillus luchuensis CBS 106.47]|uniref:Uncharacterized protein n=1 Tax=Aspergillus luchuensis (strain CBS 106.47) TaxID=1137211 RepID=A0A1M3THQ3_ASPLC|nr:hypothetical protein ASPFODRAFT_716107 [Aspergillus luchuensis CBS 106.47]